MVPMQQGYGAQPNPNTSGQMPPPNLQSQVAGAYGGALQGTQQAIGMNLGMTPAMAGTATAGAPAATAATGQATGYNAFTGMGPNGQPMAGFGAGQASGGGYDAAQMGPVGNVQAGQFAGMDMSQYMNPYLNTVVDQTAADMERARLIQQNQMNDQMQAAGAFGGSRHGIANAETNRAFYDRLGATTGQLRNLGFENARDSAFRDIGNTMQADLANQGMEYNVGAGNRDATNQARMTGANNATSASISNANNQSQLASQRLGAMNDAGRFNAGAMNDMSRFNTGQVNDTSRFNSSLGADLSRFNAGAANDTSRFNANSINSMQQQQIGNQSNLAAQLAAMSGQGFNMANTISGNQQQDGQTAQAQTQALINAAMQQFQNFSNAGNLGLGNLQSGVAAVPGGSETTTSSSNPGLLDILNAIP